ncbi:MAG: S9 family peptidase, partial [Sphingobacteriales bacterium]
MRNLLLAAVLLAPALAFGQMTTPPIARKVPKVFKEHGRERVDQYYWLSNAADSNVLAHLRAENAYVDAYMQPTTDLRRKLQDELVARIPGRDQSLPMLRNGYWYYSRFEAGKQYPLSLRRKDGTEGEEVLLDQPELAKAYKYFNVRGTAIAPDNRNYAYGVDTAGDRRCLLLVKDLSSGSVLPERISNTTGNYAWSLDSRYLFYVLNDYTVRGYKLMRHRLGADPATDNELFTERDSTYRIRISRAQDGRYIFLTSSSTNSTEVYYIDAARPEAAPVLVQPRTEGVEYSVDYYEGDRFHILTNKGAKNFRIVTAPISNPSIGNWTELVAGSDKTFIEGFEILKNYYVLQARENGLTEVKIYDRKAKKWSNLPFGQEDYVARMYLATDRFDSDSIRYV